jgi:hypothetical protein
MCWGLPFGINTQVRGLGVLRGLDARRGLPGLRSGWFPAIAAARSAHKLVGDLASFAYDRASVCAAHAVSVESVIPNKDLCVIYTRADISSVPSWNRLLLP